ncbi:hypothetical protein BH09ACT7_BH09ACT7_60340 [soil metagenome]
MANVSPGEQDSAGSAVAQVAAETVTALAAVSETPVATTLIVSAAAAAAAVPPTGILLGLLRPLGLAPGADNGAPPSPAEFATAALALVRREFEKVLGPSPTAAPTQAARIMSAAAVTGTTTAITWAWGANPVLKFNPATDKLDFGWMQANQFTVTEKSGSTVISVVDNNHTYTLSNVTVSQLQLSNIVAKDPTTIAKWQSLISNAQTPSVPTVSVANASASEGTSGATNVAFTVTLSKASTTAVTVKYVTANGTATAGQDYTAGSGTVTFAPGVTSQVITVAVLGDKTVEPSETFTVTLSSPSGATVAGAAATGTIVNDDAVVVPPGQTTAQWGNAFFAPYVDMAGWPVPNLVQMSQATGATLMTLGFIQVDPNGKPAWGGYAVLEPTSIDDQAQAIRQSIASFRAAGGDVMISFGGASGTSLAEHYAAKGLGAQALADAYKGVVDTYGVDHIDFDVEGAAVSNRAAVDLNNQALKLLQQDRPDVKIWYTLPVLPTGLTTDGLYVLESALKAGVNVAGVNVMAMDYGESAAPTTGPGAQTMGTYAIRSAQSTYSQLSTLYTKYGKSFGWKNIGVTPMLGVNDIASEVFTVADAQALEDFARAKGIGMLSMWSLERDNPGTIGQASHNASGLSSAAGSFSKIYSDYGAINVVNYGGGTGSPGQGGASNPVQGGATTTIGWQWGTNTVLNFNPATDKLDFVWMQPGNFQVAERSGSTVITIVNNNQTYTLKGVTLAKLQIGNIVALDTNTLAAWQTIINNAKAT